MEDPDLSRRAGRDFRALALACEPLASDWWSRFLDIDEAFEQGIWSACHDAAGAVDRAAKHDLLADLHAFAGVEGVPWRAARTALRLIGGVISHTDVGHPQQWIAEHADRLATSEEAGRQSWYAETGQRLSASILRVSAFPDEATAERASVAAIAANRSLVAESSAEPAPGRVSRQFVAALETVTGTVVGREEYETRTEREVRGVAIVLDAAGCVVNAWPEPVLDWSWRDRYPALAHLFGPYLGQDWPEDHWSITAGESAFRRDTSEEVQEDTAQQLDALLAATGDDDLPAAVEALGSYVVPPAQHLRRWLGRVAVRLHEHRLGSVEADPDEEEYYGAEEDDDYADVPTSWPVPEA